MDARRYLLPDGSVNSEREIAIDVRRLADDGLTDAVRRGLGYLYQEGRATTGGSTSRNSAVPSQSLIWAFNRTFWQQLPSWEATFQRGFLSALPGGVSDGTHPEFWRDRLTTFLDVLDDLDQRGLVPEEIYILELGVGTGQQAKICLDTLRELCAARGRDYFRRVRYLMSDYSHEVLHAARRTVAEHGEQVSALNVDASDPLHALSFLRYKVLFIHSSNLYDNLPTDEIVRRNGKLYDLRARAYLPAAAVEAICAAHRIEPADLPTTIGRFLRIGPEYFDDVTAGVRFWSDVWDALTLEECGVLVEDAQQLPRRARGAGRPTSTTSWPAIRRRAHAPLHLCAAELRQHLAAAPPPRPVPGAGPVRDRSRAVPRQLPRPGQDGRLDRELAQRPAVRAVGDYHGYTVHFEPFRRYREKSNTVVLTTTQKE